MADRLTNIELLIMLSDDVRAQGHDLRRDMWEKGSAHAERVLQLMRMLDKARQTLAAELKEFQQYLPPDEPMPKVVTKGPANEPVQRQDDGRGPANNQVQR